MARISVTCLARSDSSCVLWDAPAVAAKHPYQLSDSDRALLDLLRSEASEFVDHPLFHRPGAEISLFGWRRAPVSRGNRFEEMPARDSDVVSTKAVTLTAAQEIYLFQRYNYARMRAHALIRRHPEAMPDGVMREALAWGHRVMIARDHLARANTPLVLAMVKRSRLKGVDVDELISEGGMAMFNAIRKFDCGRGFKFSTYACQAILKSFSRVAIKTSRYRQVFAVEYDPAMDRSDLSDRQRSDAQVASIDELHDILVHNRASLSELEQTVIRERFALGTPQLTTRPKTLEEVSHMVGLTKEGIRQIQIRSLRKIRTLLEAAAL